MEVLELTVFASLVLGLAAVLFFAWNVRSRSHEHSEHLALLPLANDEASKRRPAEEAP
jgi:cbb3-type cytochrome oxidase maturation protein